MSPPRIVTRNELEKATADWVPLVRAQEEGFKAFSARKVVVPPVGHLSVPESNGEVHIKYGMVTGDDVFIVKVATGFYDNPKLGLPSSGGLFLVFSAKTGTIKAVLHDEGYLTDLRTAIAGHICVKHLGPREIDAIAVLGSGAQARLQVRALETLTSCRKVHVWGRNKDRVTAFAEGLETVGWSVTTCATAEAAVSAATVVITTTTSRTPLFWGGCVKNGTLIVAMGSDGDGKRELDSATLRRASLVYVDSRTQCFEFGEASYGLLEETIEADRVIELGDAIGSDRHLDTNPEGVIVADLTGVAVQDVQIAKAVCASIGI